MLILETTRYHLHIFKPTPEIFQVKFLQIMKIVFLYLSVKN